jgi:mannose-6-phosphate isomerase-like protein (cupin superfamily)
LHTEFLGLIIPGGWEEFFRFIGEPYTGPLFPTNDKRNPFEVLIPKLMAATEKFDMVPVREKASYDPQPWDGSENVLPGTCERGGYFLKADSGPKYIAGGAIVTPLATRKETSGKFSCYSIEASSLHSDKGFKETLKFSETHHAVQTVEGVMGIIIDGEVVKASAGETIFIPAGTGFKFVAESKFAKMYVFANGGGIGEALQTVGEHCTSSMVPEEKDLKPWDSIASKALKALEKELGFSTV